MALNPSCVGKSYPPSRPYPVQSETIRRFAEALGGPAAGDTDAQVAPPTFPFIVVMRAMGEVFSYDDIGFDPTYLIHGDQRFAYTRPVRVGDRLVTTLEITGAKNLRGKDVLTLRADVADDGGEPVVTLHMTFVALSAVQGGGGDGAAG